MAGVVRRDGLREAVGTLRWSSPCANCGCPRRDHMKTGRCTRGIHETTVLFCKGFR